MDRALYYIFCRRPVRGEAGVIAKMRARRAGLIVVFSIWLASCGQETVCLASLPVESSGLSGAASDEKKVEIVDYGIYSGAVVREKKDDSPGGKTNYLSEVKLLRQTDRVPAVIGTRFGIRFVVRGARVTEDVELKARILYPGLRPPGSEKPVYSTDDVIHVAAGETFFQGIMLEFDWGLVPGKWTFQLFYGDKLMAEKVFEVYKPGPAD